jgi:hypothetical protein
MRSKPDYGNRTDRPIFDKVKDKSIIEHAFVLSSGIITCYDASASLLTDHKRGEVSAMGIGVNHLTQSDPAAGVTVGW